MERSLAAANSTRFWRFSRKAVTSAEFSTGPPGGPAEANASPPKPPRPAKGGAPGGALGPGIAEVAGEREPRELRKTTMGVCPETFARPHSAGDQGADGCWGEGRCWGD